MGSRRSQTSELNRPAYTLFPLSSTISQLGILYLDPVWTMDVRNIDKKMIAHVEAIQIACLYLEQLYLCPISYINPHVIRNNNYI